MRKQPKISIIVPVKNMAGRLSNFYTWTVELNTDYELIVVHDFEDLETTKELKSHLEKHVICKYLYLEDVYGSPGAARNAGLKLATGEWVMFWDSDDVGQVVAINEWLRKDSRKEVDFEVFRFTKCNFLDENELVQDRWSDDFNQNFLNWLLEPGIWRCLFRRTRIEGLAFTEILMGEDQVFILDALTKGIMPVFSDLNSYKYYVGISGQLTSSKIATKHIEKATEIILGRRSIKLEIVTKAVDILWTKMSLSGLKKLSFYRKVPIFLQLILFALRHHQVRTTLFEVTRRKTGL
jgi:glycosyltransferase involved in cell wall biosynthesis